MTGQLRETLQTRADQLDTWEADLDAIVQRGDQRIRRRRSAAVAGALAAVLLAAGGVAAFTAPGHRSEPGPAGRGSQDHPAPLDYAVGTVLHLGARTVDVGVPVESLVRVSDGIVFSGPDRTVYLEQRGKIRRIGHLAASADTRLVAADDGHYAGWWDGRRFQLWAGTPGTRGHTDSIDVGSGHSSVPPNMLAISEEHVWMWNGAQTWVTDKPASDAVYRRYPGLPGYTVQDAAAGRLLVRFDVGMGVIDEPGPVDAPGTVTDPTQRPMQATGLIGDLSPDGRHWFTPDGDGGDAFEVVDSVTGQVQTPSFAGGHVTPYAWLDDDTVAAWVQTPRTPAYNAGPVTLLRCQVSTDACHVAAQDIGTFGHIAIDGLRIS